MTLEQAQKLLQKIEDELKRGGEVINRITALLALSQDAEAADITKAVEICVRRCEALELEVIRLKEGG